VSGSLKKPVSTYVAFRSGLSPTMIVLRMHTDKVPPAGHRLRATRVVPRRKRQC
jgi:hypothetical protein